MLFKHFRLSQSLKISISTFLQSNLSTKFVIGEPWQTFRKEIHKIQSIYLTVLVRLDFVWNGQCSSFKKLLIPFILRACRWLLSQEKRNLIQISSPALNKTMKFFCIFIADDTHCPVSRVDSKCVFNSDLWTVSRVSKKQWASFRIKLVGCGISRKRQSDNTS